MPVGFQSPFKQLGTQLQPFQAPSPTRPTAPTGYGTAAGLYGPAGGAPASVGAAPQYESFTSGLFKQVPPTVSVPFPGSELSSVEKKLLQTAGAPSTVNLPNQTFLQAQKVWGGLQSGKYDTQGAVDQLVSIGAITQQQADTTLGSYNTALADYNQQAVQAQETFDVQRGVQRRNILQQARLGEKDIFQYGRGDLFDQAVEAAYRGL